MFERKLHAEHLGDPTSRCWVPASEGGGSGSFGREWALARPGAGGIAGNGLDRFEFSEEHNHLDFFLNNLFYKLGLGMGTSKQML
jgi:hypothetical protein